MISFVKLIKKVLEITLIVEKKFYKYIFQPTKLKIYLIHDIIVSISLDFTKAFL
ncbi:protein of unknown function [Clostridium beijerinckii]|jgi:hypothetical protein|nr:protein of unknown function [Clostridium beijerinckii]